MNFIKMNQTNGYIYVRNHPSYDVDDACKMGKAINIPERDTQYATGDEWRNNSKKNEGIEPKQKQYPAVDVTGDRSKV